MKLLKLIMAIAIVAVCVACKKDSTEYLQKGLKIEAKQISTRTSFNGSKTSWETGDEMKVLVGENDAAPTAAYKFICDSGDTGSFRNEDILLNPETAYDFYAVYPYSAETPFNNFSTKINIGAATQAQDGSNPNHIAALDPLTGYAKGLYCDNVSIPMTHNAAVLVINVVNGLGRDVAGIKSLKIKAGNDIALCGTYDIDIVENKLSNPTNTSNSILVNVENSGKVVADGEFKIYAAIAPCELPSNGTLKFTVTDADNTSYEFTKVFPTGRKIEASDLLLTTLDLAQTETITYNADFTSVPDGFPKTANTQTEVKYYTFNGMDIGFYNKAGYAYNESNQYISFSSVGNTDDSATKIYLPQITGYKLSELTIISSDIQSQTLMLSLIKGENSVDMVSTSGTTKSKYIAKNTVVELETPSADALYIKVFSSSKTSRTYICKGISLTYIKSE